MSIKDDLLKAAAVVVRGLIEERIVAINKEIERSKREQYLKDNSIDVEFEVKS